MDDQLHCGVGRRQFLKEASLTAVAAGGFVLGRDARAQSAEDAPNTHNMLVFGQQAIFLSHLPMFAGFDATKTNFTSPHRYQVILEATFTKDGKDVGDVYAKDRQADAMTRIYTLSPERLVLSRLFTPAEAPKLAAFTAKVFRGHLEQGGHPVPGLEQALVKVTRIVHGRKFDPVTKRLETLEYVLFGKGSERFLAHAIFTPPDFDHVLSVSVQGVELTDKDLNQPMRIVVADRKNVAPERLREAQQVEAMLHVGSSPGAASTKVRLVLGSEVYFEEGELLVPPTFDPTAEEQKG